MRKSAREIMKLIPTPKKNIMSDNGQHMVLQEFENLMIQV